LDANEQFWRLAYLLQPVPFLLLWAVLLIRSGLYKRYRLLTAYLLWSGILTILAAYFQQAEMNRAYRTLYFIYRPGTWALSAAVLLELFRITTGVSPALSRAGRWFANGATGLAFLIGVGLAAGGSAGRIGADRWFVFERSSYIAITALSVLMLGFAVAFRLRERRNVVILSVLLAAMLGGSAVIWLLRPPERSLLFAWLMNINLTVSIVIGMLMVKPSGEALPQPAVSPEVQRMQEEIIETMQKTTENLKKDAKEGVEDPPPGD